MAFDHHLFASFLKEAPFQPATNYWRTIEIANLKPEMFPDGKGFDLGCGDGRLMNIVMKRIGKRECVGLDMDPEETALAIQEGIYSRVHTMPADQIPESNDSFDFVFSNSVLEHIQDIDSVIKEVSRILKPGGQFIFTVPGDKFHTCLSGPLLPNLTRDQYLSLIDSRCAHLRYWTEETWREHLQSVNMDIIFSQTYLNLYQVRRWETLSRFTAGVLFTLFGKRRHPIKIQRSLGMRQNHLRIPLWAGKILSFVLSAFVDNENTTHPQGCLLIVAQKQSPFA